jgi:hypothetical protein
LYDPNDDQEHDFGEEEHHETTDQIIIDVKVDAFKELSDVVRWLPKIASNGDMNESDWVQVNEISKELSPELLTILETQKDDEQRRTSYREKADSFELQISKLEKLVR